MSRAIVTGVLTAIAGGMVMAAEPELLDAVQPLPLTARAVPLDASDPARDRVGSLRYLGGLELRSPSPRFGGVSGLRLGPGGRMLGITDTGAWVTFGIVERGRRLVGVTAGVMAPLRDEDGRVAKAKSDVDAEGLEWDPATGVALVSLEQDQRVIEFASIDPARPETLDRAAVRTVRDPATALWPANGGGEAIVALTGGDHLVFEEEGQDAAGASDVLRIGSSGTTRLRYTPPAGYRPTDAVEVEPGLLLVLNRRFTITDGVSAVVTLVPVAPAMRGTEVARLAPPLTVDNMEGVALRRDGGRVFVYLVSDDNFKGFQRTLLMKFELLRGASDRPATSASRRPASPTR